MIVLWREGWLKPLSNFETGSDLCNLCNQVFKDMDFVTSCEFCEIGIMHNRCADNHILKNHKGNIEKKIQFQHDRRLHDYQ
jgi:hypothetical protein